MMMMNSCGSRNPYYHGNNNNVVVPPSSSSSSPSSFAGPQLSLSFQGVSFSLTPVSSSSTVTLLPNSPMEPLLRLENFTGTLRVSSITPPPPPRRTMHKEGPSMVTTTPSPSTVPPTLPPMPCSTHVTLPHDMEESPKKKKRGRPNGSQTKSKKKLSQIHHKDKLKAAQPMTTEPVMNKVKFDIHPKEHPTTMPYVTPTKLSSISVPSPSMNLSPTQDHHRPSLSLGQPPFASQMSQQSVSSQVTPNDDDDFHSGFTPSVIVKGPKEDSSMSASSSLHDFDTTHEEPKITTTTTNHTTEPNLEESKLSSPVVESDLDNNDTNDDATKQPTSSLTSNASPIVQVETNDDASSRNNTKNTVLETLVVHKPSTTEEECKEPPKTTVQTVLTNLLQPNKSIPTPRWGHTMTLIDHSRVLVYGGQGQSPISDDLVTFDDIFIYNLQTKKWSRPPNCLGMPRTWHTSTFLPDRQLLLSFGGENTDLKTGKVKTNDQVMVLDTEIMLWYPPSVSGTVPQGRSGHTSTYLPHSQKMVVFGGVTKRKLLTTVPVLDTGSWKWSNAKISGDAPPGRSYHTATPMDRTIKRPDGTTSHHLGIVIFGGNNNDKSFNTVHFLDTTGDEYGKWSWFHPNVSGTPPSPRTGHVAVLLQDGKTILIYGGWDPCGENEEEEIFHDSFLLDTETWTWSKGPKTKYVSGPDSRNGGSKRVGHSAVLAPSQNGTEVLAFGGRLPNEDFASDFQSLSVSPKLVGLFGS